MRKIPFAGVELTSQRVRGFRGTSELPGRPAVGTHANSILVNTRNCIMASVAESVRTRASKNSTIYLVDEL